jgi:hypothetical protein
MEGADGIVDVELSFKAVLRRQLPAAIYNSAESVAI